ncbi:hypothetical protein LCGC14_1649850 [marine sediment metagenome]|uniref:Uncharacterized protein n=1 Tax=marine sediment metagenome TaxID=412755 RepID=A0A0F9KXD4_9ZZZZ
MEQINEIFSIAKEKGLKHLSIVIFDEDNKNYNIITEREPGLNVILYVGNKDRFGCRDLPELKKALTEQKELNWAK